MKAVQVRYTVRPEFADENKANILRVMAAPRASPIDGMLYSTHTVGDGNTFLHINISRDAETRAKLNELPEFKDFQAALNGSDPIDPPVVTELELLDAGFTL
jgi:hypothetical protein